MANTFKANTLPVDPDVQVPAAVRRAAEAADAAIKAANPQPEPQPPAPANNDTITIAPPPTPTGLPERVPLTIEPAPPPPPQPDPAPPSEPPRAPNGDPGSWENKYNAMLGRFRDASAQLVQSNGRIEALETMLATVQAAPRAAAPAPSEPLVTDKDIQEMGPEMIDVMRRVAQDAFRQGQGSLKQELDDLKRQVGGVEQTTVQNAKERMLNTLDERLPEWHDINRMDEFKQWLALRDTFSGATRHSLLQQAYAQNDAVRVLAIFQGFVSETAAVRPANPNPALPPAAVPPTRPTLEDLAAPGRARTAAAQPVPAEKQIIRTSEINAFYANVRKGAYRGREEEQRKAEQELQLAMQEGRIVQDT